MRSEVRDSWPELRLEEITTKIGSGATPRGGSKVYLNSGITFIRSQNVLDYKFSAEGLVYIDDNHATQLDNVAVCENDILLNITGDSVARACIVPTDRLPARVNQHVSIIRANPNIADHRYLLYKLQFLKNQLLSYSHSGATRKALTKTMLENLRITLPPLAIQKSISDALSCLDAKIELNNKINVNLEAQAQAIFESWFVDFEPFQDGEFVESELGLIPKGWKVQRLGKVVDVKYGKDHKSLKDGNIPVYGSGGVMRYVDTALYERETVLIPRKGTLNNVMLVNHPFWSVDTMFYTEIRIPNFAKFLYQLLLTKDLAGMNVGSAVPSMTVSILNEMRFVLPTTEILEEFEKVVSSFYNVIYGNEKQNKVLSALRNTLLPKLMSGEIEIPLD